MDTSCGLCGLRPKFLQRFATPKSFMIVYGLLGTIQSMAFVYFIVSLTTMERRFKIPSKTTGIMLSGNELSQILLAVFLSFFGGQRNRPRWIAWGVLLCSLSCFILALPHFIYGPGRDALTLTKEYAYENSTMSLYTNHQKNKAAKICTLNQPETNCEDEFVLGENSWLPIILVFLSQFVLGIGNTLYFSLGSTYMDDNTKKVNTPLMLGYSLALRILGPAVGFVIGPVCLSLFIDPSLTPLITKDDPRWFGAWWLGWIIIGTLMALFSVLVGLFPKHLPKKEDRNSLPQYPKPIIKATTVDEAPLKIESQIKNEKAEKATLKDLPAALRRVIKNKVLMSNTMSGVFYILGSSAYITFMAKYMEIQYSKSAANSTKIVGPTVLLGMVFGFLISGWVISKKQPRPKILLAWNVIMGFFFLFGEASYIFFGCPVSDLEKQLMEPNSRPSLINDCNLGCNCENLSFEPVCHRPTNELFYSACHAGCSERLNGSQVFSNCKCIQPFSNISNIPFDPNWDLVHAGACDRNCQYGHLLFTLVSTLINILGSSGRIGNILVNYRCVEERDKSFAQGFMLMVISLFAMIPGPIVYGAIIDATCVEWGSSCSSRSNCVLYDRDKFRLWINLTAFGFTFVGVVLDWFVWYWGQDLNLYGDPDETKHGTPNEKENTKSNDKESTQM